MRLRLSARARRELDDLWAQIAATTGEATADRVSNRFFHRFNQLRDHPDLGPVRPEIGIGARSLVVDRWVVLCSVNGQFVDIIRVLDGRRDLRRVRWTHGS